MIAPPAWCLAKNTLDQENRLFHPLETYTLTVLSVLLIGVFGLSSEDVDYCWWWLEMWHRQGHFHANRHNNCIYLTCLREKTSGRKRARPRAFKRLFGSDTQLDNSRGPILAHVKVSLFDFVGFTLPTRLGQHSHFETLICLLAYVWLSYWPGNYIDKIYLTFRQYKGYFPCRIWLRHR